MAKRIVLENTTRDVIILPVAAGASGPGIRDGHLVLGDKMDTDDKVPEGHTRNEALQPHPRRVLSVDEYKALGEATHALIEDQVRQGRVQKTELAA